MADLPVSHSRHDEQLLAIYGLAGNEYIMLDRSVALPLLKTEDILRFLSLSASIGENNLVKQFRQWLRTFE